MCTIDLTAVVTSRELNTKNCQQNVGWCGRNELNKYRNNDKVVVTRSTRLIIKKSTIFGFHQIQHEMFFRRS